MLLNDIQSQNLKLTVFQRNAIIQAIKEAREEFMDRIGSCRLTTKKSLPFFYSDLVNTRIEDKVIENPNLNLRIYTKKSGFHPYVVIHDYVRQIFVLVSKLPKYRNIFTPSKCRGDFASSNITRLTEEGITEEQIDMVLKNKGSIQLAMTLNEEEKSPLGLIVTYDEKGETFFEGALSPDQQNWLFKYEISYEEVQRVVQTINNQHVDTEEATVVLKPSFEIDDTEIEIRLK